MRAVTSPPPSLYARVLGASWETLAEPLRRAHDTRGGVRAHGHLRVARGEHVVARVVAALLRLPAASDAAAALLRVSPHGSGEVWLRTVGGRRFRTEQYETETPGLAERFGVLEFRFQLDAHQGSVVYRQCEAAWRLGRFRARLPAAMAPRVRARESPAGANGVSVSVDVSLPGIGRLISYDGTMAFEDARA